MPRAHFLQVDIKRAVKAVQATGIVVGRIEVAPDGTVSIFIEAEKKVSVALAPPENTDDVDGWV